ncbi:MAG: NAD(P)H-hydrate dehydratase [Opitutaceae bacterium]|nr:NAD(P)H-hydrate dehydratase [Opitutaceae bacterium]
MISPASHPILSCAEARSWEHDLLGGNPGLEWAAMQRAGEAIAREMLEDCREIGGLPPRARVLVLAGKGHNGGDALLAAKSLLEKRAEARVTVLLCFGAQQLRPLALRSYQELMQMAPDRAETLTWPVLRTREDAFDCCLDGVFGFQFRAPMDEATVEIIDWVNNHPRIRLRAAVDLPSGLAEEKSAAVCRADFTYATGIVKRPVIDAANLGHVGRLRYLDLGFFNRGAPDSALRLLRAEVLQPLTQLRPPQSDKRTYGHLFVVGGSHSYPGSVLMAVQAALRSGVGLVTAFVPSSLAPTYAAHFPEAMWVGWPETGGGGLSREGLGLLRERLSRATALVIGPGLGAEPETIATIQEIVARFPAPILLDADALRPEILTAARNQRVVCTPHMGEFARMMAGASLPVFFQNQREAVVVLKGPLTGVIDREATYYSLFGGPVLARGGSGDVLAGLTGGLLAQRPEDARLAACRGAVWHGLAADLLSRQHGQVAVQTTQLFDYLRPALQMSHAGDFPRSE